MAKEKTRRQVPPPRELVYHYCSMQTFYSIVTNHTVRLSEIDKSNDRQEVVWMKDFIREAFLQQYTASPAALRKRLPRAAFAGYLENGLEKCFGPDAWYSYLGCCFSKRADLLSQWRGYADNGAGVCLGFDKALLAQLSEAKLEEFRQGSVRKNTFPSPAFGDVQYIEMGGYRAEGKTAAHTRWLKEIAKDLMEGLGDEKRRERYGMDDGRLVFARVLAAFLSSPLYKSKGFSEEEEWRILRLIEKTGYIEENLKGIAPGAEQCGCAVRGSNLVFYTDWVFAAKPGTKKAGGIIQQVVLGPRCEARRQDVSLFMAKHHCGLPKEAVTRSQISYR